MKSMKWFGVLGALFATSFVWAATYEVPVPEELQSVAKFQLDQFSALKSRRSLAIDYQLPRELVGSVEQKIHLEGTIRPRGEEFRLSGVGALARCRADNSMKHIVCSVGYGAPDMDPISREELLKKIAIDESDLAKRMAVAQLFVKDPIGIIRFSVR